MTAQLEPQAVIGLRVGDLPMTARQKVQWEWEIGGQKVTATGYRDPDSGVVYFPPGTRLPPCPFPCSHTRCTAERDRE